jgi:hypothetical protein
MGMNYGFESASKKKEKKKDKIEGRWRAASVRQSRREIHAKRP